VLIGKLTHQNRRSSSQEMATSGSQLDESMSPRARDSDDCLEQETNLDGNQKATCEEQDTDDEASTLLSESRLASSSSDSYKSPKSRAKNDDLNNLTDSKHNLDEFAHSSLDEVLPQGWEKRSDKRGPYFLHHPTGATQQSRPMGQIEESIAVYHDDDEINQLSTLRTSSEDDDYLESGAALTLADESTANHNDVMNFIVYPIGCCEFDETELVSASNTRAIQKCILRLSNNPSSEQTSCWGLDQSQPIIMRLVENYIQFLDLKTQAIYKSQPINSIKTWAVDDDNNFAFVVEERTNQIGVGANNESDFYDSVDYALLRGPTFVCYVFSSTEDDDMGCRVAAKLNEEINKYKEQLSNRIEKSKKMVEPRVTETQKLTGDQTDLDNDEDFDDLEDSTIDVNYIGKVQVPRPIGIEVLNVAIDKCLAEASKRQTNLLLAQASTSDQLEALTTDDGRSTSPLTKVKLHVSPSSVIVENTATGEIIVECRIRYLTFMGISRRDIRWCGFIMQNVKTKTFEAHCFECYPTAGSVCEAIQTSCSRMYHKMVKSQLQQEEDTVASLIPKSSKIRDTLAKTFSRIKLAPIIQ